MPTANPAIVLRAMRRPDYGVAARVSRIWGRDNTRGAHMDGSKPGFRRGWRRWWAVAAGLYLALVVLVILALFPSRADFTRAWRMQALDIERQFDLGLHGVRRELIRQRYAGLDDRATVRLIHEKFERMYPASRQLDSGAALTSRHLRGGVLPVAAPAADMLVWRDNDGTRLTRETAERLRGELQQLDARYRRKLHALPLQKSRALAVGFGMGGAALGLLWLLGLYVEKRGGAAPLPPRPEPLPHAVSPPHLRLPDLAGLKETLAGWMRPTLGH